MPGKTSSALPVDVKRVTCPTIAICVCMHAELMLAVCSSLLFLVPVSLPQGERAWLVKGKG